MNSSRTLPSIAELKGSQASSEMIDQPAERNSADSVFPLAVNRSG